MKPGIRVPINNQLVDSNEMGFTAEGDGLVVLKIEDGTVLELRHSVLSIYKAKEADANGQPQYFIMGGSGVTKTVPQTEESVVAELKAQ